MKAPEAEQAGVHLKGVGIRMSTLGISQCPKVFLQWQKLGCPYATQADISRAKARTQADLSRAKARTNPLSPSATQLASQGQKLPSKLKARANLKPSKLKARANLKASKLQARPNLKASKPKARRGPLLKAKCPIGTHSHSCMLVSDYTLIVCSRHSENSGSMLSGCRGLFVLLVFVLLGVFEVVRYFLLAVYLLIGLHGFILSGRGSCCKWRLCFDLFCRLLLGDLQGIMQSTPVFC